MYSRQLGVQNVVTVENSEEQRMLRERKRAGDVSSVVGTRSDDLTPSYNPQYV
jgi:hypothetical protein